MSLMLMIKVSGGKKGTLSLPYHMAVQKCSSAKWIHSRHCLPLLEHAPGQNEKNGLCASIFSAIY